MSNISQEASQKIGCMSFLCAIFVVLIHCGDPRTQYNGSWYISQLVFNGIAGIAVPFFFLASGYFIGQHKVENGEYASEVKKRLKSLVLPFYFWNTSYWLFGLTTILAANILHHTALSRNMHFSGMLDLTGLWKGTCMGPLWYVRTLFILVIISPIIARLNKHKLWLILPASCIAAYLLIRPEIGTEHTIKHLCRFLFSPTGFIILLLRNVNCKKPHQNRIF